MSDYEVTLSSDNFYDLKKNTTAEEGIFNDDGNLSKLPLN